MLAVTNTFENKTAEALTAISPNLIAAEPTSRRSRMPSSTPPRRPTTATAGVRGSRVRWSRDWDASFGDELLDRVIAFLRP